MRFLDSIISIILEFLCLKNVEKNNLQEKPFGRILILFLFVGFTAIFIAIHFLYFK